MQYVQYPRKDPAEIARPTRAGRSAWEIIVLFGMIALLAAVLFPVFAQSKVISKKTPTLSNLKQDALGCLMYSGDYDDILPRANHWMDDIYPYTKNEWIFHDPLLQDKDGYGFAFRDEVSSAKTTAFNKPAEFVFLFTSTLLNRNAHSDLSTMPLHGRKDGTNFVAYLDGHTRGIHSLP